MKKLNIRWQLVAYDFFILAMVDVLLLVFYRGVEDLSAKGIAVQIVLSYLCVFSARLFGNVYRQIWRYGGIQCYIKLLIVDFVAFVFYLSLDNILYVLPNFEQITFVRLVSISCINLLGALAIRMMYRYAYKCGNNNTPYGRFLNSILHFFAGPNINGRFQENDQKIKIAIIGAGRVGVSLAEELLSNVSAAYVPRCQGRLSRSGSHSRRGQVGPGQADR